MLGSEHGSECQRLGPRAPTPLAESGHVGDDLHGLPAVAAHQLGQRAPGEHDHMVRMVDLHPPDEAGLSDFAASRLAKRKVPSHWLFFDAFPVTEGMGKFDRAALKKMGMAHLKTSAP